MTYKIPTCTCGGELFYSTEHVFKVNRTINKNGTLSKTAKIVMELGNASCYGYEYLICKECPNEYIYDYDEKGRVINLRNSDDIDK